MIKAGMYQEVVAEAMGVSLRILKYWWATYKKTGRVEKKKRIRRPRLLEGLKRLSFANWWKTSVKDAEILVNECSPRFC